MSCDIVLSDRLISRNHAMVRCLSDNDYYIIDSGSANGSYVNGKRINKPTLLKNNDQITIGPITLIFQQQNKHPCSSSVLPYNCENTLSSATVHIEQIAILVADIRDFTRLSESVPIHTLSKLMSEWFYHVSASVDAHNGTLEKFIGDCVYARWDVVGPVGNVVHNVLRAALHIHRITDALNKNFPELPQLLRIGAGVNIGNAAVGVGQDNTALGDAVNTTFRLENASKALKCDVVVGHDAYIELPHTLWKGRERVIVVKGKRDPLRVCTLNFSEIL
jgi:adenylate cyclase